MAALLSAPRWPDRPRNLAPSFALALAMHALLFAGLSVAVRWNVEPQAAAYAELWGALPPLETPRPAPVPQPAPEPPPREAMPEPVQSEADIALERARSKREQERLEAERQRLREEARKKAEADTRIKTEEARQAAEDKAFRDAMAKRMSAQAAQAASAGGGSPSGVRGAAGADQGYSAAVVACIRPHLAFAVPEGTSPEVAAEFRVDLLPDASVAAVVLQKRSGLAGYDAAAERAIRRCDPFPRKRDGSVERTITVRLRPVETR